MENSTRTDKEITNMWIDQAACRGTTALLSDDDDPPVDGLSEAYIRASDPLRNASERFCVDCPVRVDCMAAGMREPWDVYGGVTPLQRRRIRSRQRRGFMPRKLTAEQYIAAAEKLN